MKLKNRDGYENNECRVKSENENKKRHYFFRY